MKKLEKLMSIGDLPEVAVSNVPTLNQKTGTWRVYRPEVDKGKCIKCSICWRCCPEISIDIDKEGFPIIKYDYCKGCGICAHECPTTAIQMEREGK
ncbi:MAG: F420H2 dehydrogenase Fpo, FpoI subunit [Candidatus Methanofastidiosum methylothiophilum]|jgi:pyruvate ferredoxin oxidoreductase delta subunit|uniref:F420H2 dehydrogenase Fpo, FpoI subunit n=1 Tax=Candidatus Methanofastidiosum methylothiophilum TaxID=1705564 RepID=A0A150JEJ9_9EURY|nr:MAG: F420H2 dehydrogenase Fpo, FpoI subunit [Candidatus Methanofastidiosum methylthiophilus]